MNLNFLPDDLVIVPTSNTGRPAEFDLRYKGSTRKWRLSQQAADSFGRENGISVRYSANQNQVYIVVGPLAKSEVWKGKTVDSNRGLEFSHTKLKTLAQKAGLTFNTTRDEKGNVGSTDFRLEFLGQNAGTRFFVLMPWEGDSGILDLGDEEEDTTPVAPRQSEPAAAPAADDFDDDVPTAEVIEDGEDYADGKDESESDDFDFD